MSDPESTAQAAQAMLLRTWPNAKSTSTVASAGTPQTVDLSAFVGRTVYFRATVGKIFGLTFQNGDTPPVPVDGEDFEVTVGQLEELYVWGDGNLRLRIDTDTDGGKLHILSDAKLL